MEIQRKRILDIPIDITTHNDALDHIVKSAQDPKSSKLVVTPYASFWFWAERDREFKQALQESDLSLPDGIGVLAAAKFSDYSFHSNFIIRSYEVLSRGLKVGAAIITRSLEKRGEFERVTGVDLVENLFSRAQEKGLKIYFLGGWPQAQVSLRARLEKEYPQLQFEMDIGSTNVRSYVGKRELEKSIARINTYKPDILLVAFGPPFQETWAYTHLDTLQVSVVMCVGATFDLLSGELKRAPKFFQKSGLEWFWRFLTQPSRIGRIVAAFPFFPVLVAWETLKSSRKVV